MGTDTWGAGRNRGPRRSRTARTTEGYEPVNPSAAMISNTLVESSRDGGSISSAIRLPQRSSTTRSEGGSARADGGPPALSHFETVAG
jgi:hypothetical protein